MTQALDYHALHAIGFAAGAALSALLWNMQRGVDRSARSPSGYQLLWTVGIVWTLGNFLQHALQLGGAGVDSISVRLAGMLAWSCTILGPLAIGRFLQARIGEQTVASKWFTAIAAAASALNLGLLIRAAATHAFDLDVSWYPDASLYVALSLTVLALILYHGARHEARSPLETAKPRWLGRAMVLLVSIQVAAALLGLQAPGAPAALSLLAALVSEHWTIPWSILIAVALAQVHYADLVLKRSLWLLASIAIAALVSAFILRAPAGMPMLVSTLGCAALMLTAPLLIRGLHLLVDRVWLDRVDHSAAAGVFEESLRRIYDREQLFHTAVSTVASTLRLDARFVRPAEQATPPAHNLASIPIETQGQLSHRMEISASHHARTLTPEELAFLRAIGVHVSRRLDVMHLEQEQRALLLREEKLQRLLTEAELKALRTQVDPHFLFNTLNTIAELIGSNPQQAERMTERLAECFRYALSRHSRHLSTLDDELEFARHYLEIEQVRFGDRLRVRLSRGDADGNEAVPSLLLQPLLENAIRHGLAPLREGGCISVIAKREGEHLRLQIEDDGVGMRADLATKSGIGLQNVKERLHTLYSQAAKLAVDRGGGGRGTRVTILVPLHAD